MKNRKRLKMQKILNTSFAFLFLFSSMVFADTHRSEANPETTVQGLYRLCKNYNTPTANINDATLCLGYISGVTDLMLNQGMFRGDTVTGICASTGTLNIPYEAAIRSFINWAERHPELWTKDRLFGVLLSLRETWPCGKKPS
jgi:hypothetical protein